MLGIWVKVLFIAKFHKIDKSDLRNQATRVIVSN